MRNQDQTPNNSPLLTLTDSETAAARTDKWMDGWMDGWMTFVCSVIMSGVCHHSSSLQEHGLDNLHM